MTLKLLLVDDEDDARDILKQYIAETREIVEIVEARNGIEAISIIKVFKPQIIFLDIEMPEVSGFDVLYQFEDRSFKVVFQTAYNEYAVKAFEEDAIDYILKPFTKERFDKAFYKAIDSLKTEKKSSVATNLSGWGFHLEKISVKVGNTLKIIPVSEILYFKAELQMVKLYTSSLDYACEIPLRLLEERLDPKIFTRIHRNCLVNIHEVKSLTSEKGRTTLTMSNGCKVEVSRDKSKLLKDLFKF
ncbi:MAG: LytTR family transcriptional regulator DNA-binding domain-containing protein [Pseudobacteriovorax sp.]|nr:LytTR family transcriptional regulator DNA-binding domain-containing protein [Pseudobacteriovorax sp.]